MEKDILIKYILKYISNTKVCGKATRSKKTVTIDTEKLKKRAIALGLALIVGTSLVSGIFSEEISLLKSGIELKGMVNEVYNSDEEVKGLVDSLDRCKNQSLGNFMVGNPFDTSSILYFGVPPCEENCSACMNNTHAFEKIEEKLRTYSEVAEAIDYHEALRGKTEGKNM